MPSALSCVYTLPLSGVVKMLPYQKGFTGARPPSSENSISSR